MCYVLPRKCIKKFLNTQWHGNKIKKYFSLFLVFSVEIPARNLFLRKHPVEECFMSFVIAVLTPLARKGHLGIK